MEQLTSSDCRLCLDPFAENVRSIDDPEFKQQIQQVFNFSIEPKDGYSSKVCQSCIYTISEFYKYSEKVRLNQQRIGGVSVADTFEVEVSFENVKVELVEGVEQDSFDGGRTSVDTVKLESESDRGEGTSSDSENSSETYVPPGRQLRKRPTGINRRRRHDVDQKPKKTTNTKSKEELERDDKLIHDFYQMVCDLCGDPAPSFVTLMSHFREIHNRSGYVVCCKKKLFRRSFLLHHITFHTNPSAFRCELCNKNYKNKAYLSQHQMKAHSSEEERPFKCTRCKQSYAKKCMLEAHMASHEKVQCPQCDRMLSNKGALSVHLIKMHSEIDRKMICDTCGQGFLNKVCFENHVMKHMGIEVTKKFQCPVCQKWLTGERGLQKHLRFTHNEMGGVHTCDVCQQQYPNSRALWSHKRVVHIVEKFECEFCGKKFKRAINLKEHRTIHTGEVLYACEFCGVTMNSKANLYTHTKKNHPEEWKEKKLKATEANIPTTQA
ncbi:transcription factor grauzone-like [Toxorhynchites rutilus septentrionalis]|uniref:transcription factor grauzone-like n=1 Tax=Toxorhynchites rutilus septentrionalis TaxID=329112 RepID=UPI002478E71B|nr:transcription factor grauzone-like [Toxorhynchites rutilus septentrionalis]